MKMTILLITLDELTTLEEIQTLINSQQDLVNTKVILLIILLKQLGDTNGSMFQKELNLG